MDKKYLTVRDVAIASRIKGFRDLSKWDNIVMVLHDLIYSCSIDSGYEQGQ